MLYAKLRDHKPISRRRFLKGFTIYEHGGNLGHGTWTILYKLYYPFPGRLHMIFVLIGQAVSEKMMFENNSHIHAFSPGAGADEPMGYLFL